MVAVAGGSRRERKSFRLAVLVIQHVSNSVTTIQCFLQIQLSCDSFMALSPLLL